MQKGLIVQLKWQSTCLENARPRIQDPPPGLKKDKVFLHVSKGGIIVFVHILSFISQLVKNLEK
jgi:hypothetical protein